MLCGIIILTLIGAIVRQYKKDARYSSVKHEREHMADESAFGRYLIFEEKNGKESNARSGSREKVAIDNSGKREKERGKNEVVDKQKKDEVVKPKKDGKRHDSEQVKKIIEGVMDQGVVAVNSDEIVKRCKKERGAAEDNKRGMAKESVENISPETAAENQKIHEKTGVTKEPRESHEKHDKVDVKKVVFSLNMGETVAKPKERMERKKSKQHAIDSFQKPDVSKGASKTSLNGIEQKVASKDLPVNSGEGGKIKPESKVRFTSSTKVVPTTHDRPKTPKTRPKLAKSNKTESIPIAKDSSKTPKSSNRPRQRSEMKKSPRNKVSKTSESKVPEKVSSSGATSTSTSERDIQE